ncbi:MAG TPA: PA14 domain-containing protein, partial [Tepidisphaeraceae bacterium]|nr:PA14 domain-containing protein [Tepidisphaeraceae bacterium]
MPQNIRTTRTRTPASPTPMHAPSPRSPRTLRASHRAVCEMLEQRLVLSTTLAPSPFMGAMDYNWLASAPPATVAPHHPTVGKAPPKTKPPVISAATGYGLKADYFSGASLAGAPFTRVDPTVNFTWGVRAPAPGLKPGNFSARWTGTMIAPRAGVYKFFATAVGGTRLLINGVDIINNPTASSLRSSTALGTATFTAGQAAFIELDYFSTGRRA